MSNPKVNVAICGLGTVGGHVFKILKDRKEELSKKLGFDIEVKKVFSKTGSRANEFKVSKKMITDNLNDVIKDQDIHIVVESIGDQPIAKKIISQSLKNGKQVVTANKAILSRSAKELYALSDSTKVGLFYEAAVGGAIPILRSIRESFLGDEILSISGIINGTSNYILTKMESTGRSFQDILKEAQDLGFAEANPSADVDGWDTAHKLVILSGLAFKADLNLKNVHVEGISRISPLDIEMCLEFGYRIKLLGIAKRLKNQIEIRVHPTLVSTSHLLSSVSEAFNAVMIKGKYSGPSLLFGLGAGGSPTANSVVADIIEAARNVHHDEFSLSALGYPSSLMKPVKVKAMSKISNRYYIRIRVKDKPGVLAKITSIFSEFKVSLSSIHQPDQQDIDQLQKGKEALIMIMTHISPEKNISLALAKINKLSVVIENALLIRVEDFSS